MRMPARNSRSPMRSFRKLVLRAIDAPLIADARCPTSDPAMRGSNTIGTRRVSTLRGLSRRIARSPALRPILLGRFQVGGVQRRGEIVVALHAGAFAGDRHRGHRVARAHIGAAKAVARHQHHAADAGRRRSRRRTWSTPFTPSAACSAARADRSSAATSGTRASIRSSSGKSRASALASARPA